MNLKKWQQDFYQGIFNPTQSNIQRACQGINETETLNASQRLDIYRGSVFGGITDGLTGMFPVCKKLVGSSFFNHMLNGFFKKNPSYSPNLGDYGARLTTYITQFEAAKNLVYLSDIAQLEWLWHMAFNASDVSTYNIPVYTLNKLASITEHEQARIQFVLQPSVQLMQSDYPIHLIWHMNKNNDSGTKTINLDDGQTNLLIYRAHDYSMNINPLNDDEFSLYKALQNGLLLSDIADLTLSKPLEALLPAIIQSGLITGFNLAEPCH